MVSNRIMVAPITTATWAARVMLRPAVAATNRERPGKPARLVIGKRALRERKIVDLAEGCTKKSGLSKATGWKPPKCPHPGRGVNAAPAQDPVSRTGPKRRPLCRNKGASGAIPSEGLAGRRGKREFEGTV